MHPLNIYFAQVLYKCVFWHVGSTFIEKVLMKKGLNNQNRHFFISYGTLDSKKYPRLKSLSLIISLYVK